MFANKSTTFSIAQGYSDIRPEKVIITHAVIKASYLSRFHIFVAYSAKKSNFSSHKPKVLTGPRGQHF